MTKLLPLLFLTFFILSCKRETNCDVNEKVLKSNDSILAKVRIEKSFTDFLSRIKEQKLETLNDETYRFVITDASGSWQVYRISKKSNGYFINSKSYVKYIEDTVNQKELEIDSWSKEVEKPIHKNDWIDIQNKLGEMNFWSLPVVDGNHHYLDPTRYLIEGYNPQKNICTNRKYHLTERTCPSDSSQYKSIFIKVTSLAK